VLLIHSFAEDAAIWKKWDDSFSYANWSHNGYRCEQHLNSKRNGVWLYNDNNNVLVVGHLMHLNKYYDWHDKKRFEGQVLD
jgi:hypothetical protein